MIYFIQQGKVGPIKIGYSENVERRMTELQTGCAFKLVLLFEEPGSKEDEKHYHAQFAKHRLNGEWFNPANEIKEYIQQRLSFDQKAFDAEEALRLKKHQELVSHRQHIERLKAKASPSDVRLQYFIKDQELSLEISSAFWEVKECLRLNRKSDAAKMMLLVCELKKEQELLRRSVAKEASA